MTNVCGSVRGGSMLVSKSLIYSSTSCPDTKIISCMPKSLEGKREEKLSAWQVWTSCLHTRAMKLSTALNS